MDTDNIGPLGFWNFPILSRLRGISIRGPPKPWWSEVAYDIEGDPPNLDVNVIVFDTWKDPPFSFRSSKSISVTQDTFDREGNYIRTDGPYTLPKDIRMRSSEVPDTTLKIQLNEIYD